LADRAFEATHGAERFLVYVEAYTTWVESAPWNLLAKSGLLSEHRRMPTLALVFVLHPRGHRDHGGTFRLEVAGNPTQQLWFREVRLWEVEPQKWWEHYPGLMALTPLCRHTEGVREVVIHAAEAIRYRSLDTARRADLLTTLAIFGKLAEGSLDVFSIIGRQEMHDNPLIREFIQEGRQEGRQEGELTASRIAVRLAVEAKFGTASAAKCDPQLGKIADLVRLQTLLQRAVTAEKFSQVQRALRDAAR
jgi:predicted transposase YdaD